MDSRELRNVFGKFATGVCVITTGSEDVPGFGMTVNSFSSLSLDPPLVMWSIGKDSDCFDRFARVSGYAVNVLMEDQQHLSDRYSKKNDHGLGEDDRETGETGLPVLKSPLAIMECQIIQRVDGGDHEILIGRVNRAWQNDEGRPLLFFAGRYSNLSA